MSYTVVGGKQGHAACRILFPDKSTFVAVECHGDHKNATNLSQIWPSSPLGILPDLKQWCLVSMSPQTQQAMKLTLPSQDNCYLHGDLLKQNTIHQGKLSDTESYHNMLHVDNIYGSGVNGRNKKVHMAKPSLETTTGDNCHPVMNPFKSLLIENDKRVLSMFHSLCSSHSLHSAFQAEIHRNRYQPVHKLGHTRRITYGLLRSL